MWATHRIVLLRLFRSTWVHSNEERVQSWHGLQGRRSRGNDSCIRDSETARDPAPLVMGSLGNQVVTGTTVLVLLEDLPSSQLLAQDGQL